MRARAVDLALLLAVGVFWGLNWPAVRTMLDEVPPWTMRSAAFVCGTVLLLAVARLSREKLVPARGEVLPLAAAGLFTILGFNICAAYGQLLTETSKAAIIAFTMPMWAALLSVLLLGERLTPLRLAALAVGLAGLAVLVGEDFAAFVRSPAGVAVMLGSALSWALGTVILKMRTWSVGPIARAAWLIGVSIPPAVLGALLFEEIPDPSALSAKVLWVFAYHVALPMVFSYAAWTWLVQRLPASVAAIGTLIVPVVGVLSAVVLLGEPLTVEKLAALALVLTSIALTFWRPARRPVPAGPRIRDAVQ